MKSLLKTGSSNTSPGYQLGKRRRSKTLLKEWRKKNHRYRDGLKEGNLHTTSSSTSRKMNSNGTRPRPRRCKRRNDLIIPTYPPSYIGI
jgi:hypothetical protein